MPVACEGHAGYETLPDGSISVNGTVPMYAPDSPEARKILDLHARFGAEVRKGCAPQKPPATPRCTEYNGKQICEKWHEGFGMQLPEHWFWGILMVESGGNPYACSPCIKFDSKGNQICSFAPGCGSGKGADGKEYSCCAYGLMQFIDWVARDYGVRGWDLMGRPDLAIELACKLNKKNLAKYGIDNYPKVAASYNAGSPKCSGQGTFGFRDQRDYAYKAVKAANTALALGITRASSTGVLGAGMPGWLVALAAGAGVYLAMTRTDQGRRLTRQAQDALGV